MGGVVSVSTPFFSLLGTSMYLYEEIKNYRSRTFLFFYFNLHHPPWQLPILVSTYYLLVLGIRKYRTLALAVIVVSCKHPAEVANPRRRHKAQVLQQGGCYHLHCLGVTSTEVNVRALAVNGAAI